MMTHANLPISLNVLPPPLFINMGWCPEPGRGLNLLTFKKKRIEISKWHHMSHP